MSGIEAAMDLVLSVNVVLKVVVVVHQTSQMSVRTSSMVNGQHVVPGRGRLCLKSMDGFGVVA